MKPNNLTIKYLILALVAISWLATNAIGQEDLFSRNKSDSTIKMLVFPLSMAVVENRPRKGLYFFYEGETRKFNQELNGKSESLENPLFAILSDAKTIKKTLVKSDPTRVSPAKQYEDLLGTITKVELKQLSSKYKKDMILVFRRDIYLQPDAKLHDTLYQHPEELLNLKTRIDIKIKNTALLYLAKQNKVLMIPSNEQSKTILPGGSAKSELQDLANTGLQKLAKQTKKVIRDNQFTVRRSNY
jgi:hypothetical protein